MRSVRFTSTTCSFVVVSESCLLLPTHFVGGRSLICPKAVERDCSICRGMRPRLLGYVVARGVSAHGEPSDIILLELPESLLRLMLDQQLACLPSKAQWYPAHGIAVVASREAKRRPWHVESVKRVVATTMISDDELLDGVSRLFSLPLTETSPGVDPLGKIALSVVARHDLYFREAAAAN